MWYKSGEGSTHARLIVGCVVLMAVACRRSPDESANAQVDALFAEWNAPDSPGCGVGVSRNGTIVYERGYGMANLERRVPITSATVFDPASIAKPFTAMSIMLLAEQGRLSLDDPVWRHIPEWVNRQDRITIRHLLGHTGGLRDVFLLVELAAPRPESVDINDHLLRILARQRGLNFEPGSEFSYSNGAYNLLASIVKRASGRPFHEFADVNIFKPLGMSQTAFRSDPVAIGPSSALGYHQDERGFHLAREGGVDTSTLVGNSGLFTTVRDLLRWQQNFADPRVGDRALLAEMQRSVVLGGGGVSPYGLGLEVGQDRGLKTVGHGGGDRGIAAYLIRYPERDLAVAVLCNLDNLAFRVGALARQVAGLYLPGLSQSAAARAPNGAPAVTLTAADLASKTGLYRHLSTDTFGRVYVRDGRLMASADAGEGPGDSVELTPITENRFVVAGTSIVAEFVPGAAGRPQQVRVTGAGPKRLISERVVTGWTPTRAELAALVGRYASSELEIAYTLVTRGTGLVIQIPGRADIPLQPILPDAFYGSLVDVVRFSRGARNAVTGFTINRASVRNLRFERVQSVSDHNSVR